jgi:hypothetical protein
MILFSPAFSLNWNSYLIKPLLPLKYFDLSLPSAAPLEYRVDSSTSFDGYSASFTAVERANRLSNPQKLKALPVKIFANPKDIIVNFSGIMRWLKHHGLTQRWAVDIVRPKPRISGTYNHLIIDERSLGTSEWNRVKQSLVSFFISLS